MGRFQGQGSACFPQAGLKRQGHGGRGRTGGCQGWRQEGILQWGGFLRGCALHTAIPGTPATRASLRKGRLGISGSRRSGWHGNQPGGHGHQGQKAGECLLHVAPSLSEISALCNPEGRNPSTRKERKCAGWSGEIGSRSSRERRARKTFRFHRRKTFRFPLRSGIWNKFRLGQRKTFHFPLRKRSIFL